MPHSLPDIAIDGKPYPCDTWELVEKGERLEQIWDKGFAGGMGQFLQEDEERCYGGFNFDVTSPPFLRLGLRPAATISATNLDTAQPMYAFFTESPDGTNFAYILNDRRAYKVNMSNNNLESTHDFGAGAICGRWALFETDYYVPLGASVNARKLTAVTNVGGGNDTWTDVGAVALHFASLMKDGIAQLARAHTTNLVDLSADGSSFAGDDFEVGDTSLPIIDLLTWLGELAVIKADSVHRFDQDGNSSPVQGFVGRSGSPTTTLSMSEVHGPYLYWMHHTGPWRVLNDRAQPLGPQSELRYVRDTIGNVTGLENQNWSSASAWSRWIYVSDNTTIHLGYIRDDGSVIWYWNITQPSGAAIFVAITEGGTSGAPALWAVDTDSIFRYDLEVDGSPRSIVDTGSRGLTSTTHSFATSFTDLAGGRLRNKLKQLRLMWVSTVGWPATVAPLQLGFEDEQGNTRNVGTTIGSSGYFERTPTSGTNDTFRELAVTLSVATTAGYTADDPLIRSFGIEAVTASIYRAVIPLISERIKGRRSMRRQLKDLRDLQNGAQVVVRDPENPSSTFNAQIVSVAEEAVPLGVGKVGYMLTVELERYDWADGV